MVSRHCSSSSDSLFGTLEPSWWDVALSQLLAEASAGLLRSRAAALVVCVDDAKSIRTPIK
jgi:hypothetical protein